MRWSAPSHVGVARKGRPAASAVLGASHPLARTIEAISAVASQSLAVAAALLQCVSQFAYYGRLDRRGRRTYEFTEFLELGHDDLALHAELLGELVYPDLSHFAPFRSGLRRTVATSWAYSSRAHRVLIAISTYFQLAGYQGRMGFRAALPTVLPAGQRSRQPRHSGAVPRCRAVPGPEGPAGTPGGGAPGRDRPGRGVHTHPGRAAYRLGRGRRCPRSPRCAAAHSWPLAPGTPHRCAQGMLGHASGQTRLSLPPRTDLTPLGQESNGCCLDQFGNPGDPG